MFSDLISKLQHIRERATPQVKAPFYIGLGVGFVLLLLVLLGFLNTESFLAAPSSFEGVATSQAIWGLKPSNLMMVLPLGAFLVVLARSFIGLKAFGLFTPMLIALAFLQIGPVMGPIVLGSSVLVGMIIAPALLKLRMTRVGFLGVLISLIVLTLVALQLILDRALQVDAFPVVVCALVVERWWRQWEKDGPYEAARLAFNTFMIAVVIQFVMVSNLALMLIEASPLLMPAFTAIAIAILGRYRGLRITEIGRFAPIWLERRRNANNREKTYPTVQTVGVGSARDPTPEQLDLLRENSWVIDSVDDVVFAVNDHTETKHTKANADDAAHDEPRFGASATGTAEDGVLIRSLGKAKVPRPWRQEKINPKRVSEYAERRDATLARQSSWVIRAPADV